jgi:RNA polymerase sigma factor (sigma-70 family)
MKTIVLHIASPASHEVKPPMFDEAYLTRLRAGDDKTAEHFQRHFRRVVNAQLWGKFSPQRQEDLVDEVMAAAFEKIMRGEPRDATRLSAYVRGICLNLSKTAMRPASHKDEVELDFDRLSSNGQTIEEELIHKETAAAITKVLSMLSVRDRGLLVDVFYSEIDRDEVCRKHHVTREQLRLILFRARQRFQECWKASEIRHVTKSNRAASDGIAWQ